MVQPNYTEHIGFLVTEAVDDCLRLQSLLQGTGKGTLVRNIVIVYANDNGWTVEELTERYARHLYSQWELRWQEKIDFRSYMVKSAVDLQERYKLPERLSKRIIELCKEQHEIKQALKK